MLSIHMSNNGKPAQLSTMRIAVVFVGLLTIFKSAWAANILGVFFIPSISHQLFYRAYTKELNQRGHNLTIFTTDPANDPTLANYTEFDLGYYYPQWRKRFDMATDAAWILRIVPELFYWEFTDSTNEMCELYLSDPNVQRVIKEGAVYDLVVIEFGVQPCIYAFGSLSKTRSMMGIFSFSLGAIVQSNIGNTASAAYLPDPFFPYLDHMTLGQRARTLVFQAFTWLYYWYVHADHLKIARKYFGPDTPSLIEFERNISAIMTNDHFSQTFPRPKVPNYVDIGGSAFHLHHWTPTPLPHDLQKFLDSGEEGVIYFSLGSNVKSSTMPESKRAMFLDAFRQINRKVLWKWETDDLPGKPDNVKLQKWLPQTDVLAHPNVKLFITQGGLQSMGEATHFEKPMIVVPFFADQELNAKKLESVGVAERLDFETMTTEDIVSAINSVMDNVRYKEAMMRYSALTKDQPETPMERAVWWTEYVLRHNGARHLRSPAVDMPWYQYFMLDVLGFLLAVILTSIWITVFVSKKLVKALLRKTKTKKD